MRNFINIVDPTPKIDLFEAKQYEGMFTSLEVLFTEYEQTGLLTKVLEAKALCRDLRQNDRQIWCARIVRLWLLNQADKLGEAQFYSGREDFDEGVAFASFRDQISKMFKKYGYEYQKITGEAWPATGEFGFGDGFIYHIRDLILYHYLGINYSKIQNYKFVNQTFDDLVNDLRGLEEEYKELSRSLVTLEPGDEIILKLPNDYVWVMLSRGSCGYEGDAMGHCGNAGAKAGDRIISLRRPKAVEGSIETHYEVFLTFILNRDGRLGEMKGRSNSKPSEKYHDQIVALLKLPFIKGLRGGGYKPENNFKLTDLPDEKQEELINHNPQLGSFTHRYTRLGASPEFIKEIMDILKDDFGFYHGMGTPEGENIPVKVWKNVADLVEHFATDKHTNDVATGEFDFEPTVDEDNVESLYDDLPLYAQIALSNKALEAIEEAGDEDELDIFDPTDSGEVVEKLKEYDLPEWDALTSAAYSGYEVGARDEAHKLLVSSIKSLTPRIGKLVFTEYKHEGREGFEWDSPIKLILTVKEACAFIDSGMGDNEDGYSEREYGYKSLFDEDEKIEVDEPYYGYSDFDTESAIQRFWEEADLKEEKTPSAPDFLNMSPDDLKTFIKSMYEKIPDAPDGNSYVRKNDPDNIEEWRLPGMAMGLFYNYYGGKKP